MHRGSVQDSVTVSLTERGPPDSHSFSPLAYLSRMRKPAFDPASRRAGPRFPTGRSGFMRCGAAGGPLGTPDGPCRVALGTEVMRPTYFNEQMSARFLMPIPKVRPNHFIG